MAFYRSRLFKEIIGAGTIVMVDIGARGGLPPRWRPLQDSLQIIGFEPDENECRRLNAAAGSGRVCYPVALAGSKGRRTLYLTRDRDCCSIIEPDTALLNRFRSPEDFDVTGKLEIPCDTLDNIVAANNIASIDLIKIDTQGAEMEILRGAEKTLAQSFVFGVEVEVEFSRLYRGQPLFNDVDAFLRGAGYTLFDIRTPPGRKVRKTAPAARREWSGQALWTDALYFRDFPAIKNGFLKGMTGLAAVKTIAIAELYGFGDFALELLELYGKENIIPPAEGGEIGRELRAGAGRGLGPEAGLLQSIKSAAGAYAQQRLPALYKLLTPRPEKKS
jgi:FkbM family methyltransferase